MAEQLSVAAQKAPVYSALKHRNFRLYWIGLLAFAAGTQIQFMAQSWLVLELTDSPTYLGLAGLFSSGPTIVLSLFGGVLADRVDRRRVLIATQLSSMFILLLLGFLIAFGKPSVWTLLLITAVQGAVLAFDQPARQSIVPNLVPKEGLMNAIALQSTVWNSARIVAPALGGVLIGAIGVAGCYFLIAAGALVTVVSFWAIRLPARQPQAGSGSMAKNLVEGLDYIRQEPVCFALIVVTFINSIFGMSYISLMPIFARDILNGGSNGFGLLLGAAGVGALLGTLLLAWLGDFRNKGLLLIVTSAFFGLSLLLFAYSQSLALSVALMLAGGLANSIYMTTIQTLLQTMVPDHLRGRVMGTYSLVWFLTPLGGVQSGAIASFFGAPLAIGFGGLVVAATAVFVGVRLPFVRRL